MVVLGIRDIDGCFLITHRITGPRTPSAWYIMTRGFTTDIGTTTRGFAEHHTFIIRIIIILITMGVTIHTTGAHITTSQLLGLLSEQNAISVTNVTKAEEELRLMTIDKIESAAEAGLIYRQA